LIHALIYEVPLCTGSCNKDLSSKDAILDWILLQKKNDVSNLNFIIKGVST